MNHEGIRYWTTDELAGSLIARQIISGAGRRTSVRRAVRRWAANAGLEPVVLVPRGPHLWPEPDAWRALDRVSLDIAACPT